MPDPATLLSRLLPLHFTSNVPPAANAIACRLPNNLATIGPRTITARTATTYSVALGCAQDSGENVRQRPAKLYWVRMRSHPRNGTQYPIMGERYAFDF